MPFSLRARVSALFVHPIKSAAAIAVDSLVLDDRGAVGDRRWLVVDEAGMQITARETPALALVRPMFVEGDDDPGALRNVDGALWLSAPNLPRHRVELPVSRSARMVQVWADHVAAHDAGDEVAQWMSAAIGRPCRLVHIADDAQRPLRPKYSGQLSPDGRHVAFSDGAPLLILGQASVDALSARLVEQGGEPMVVARFRPNILLSYTTAHEEDTWSMIRIGAVRIAMGAACERCVMTTIDPATGERGVEPLRMLASYRRYDGKVMFGMNATHAAEGTVHLGDRVVRVE